MAQDSLVLQLVTERAVASQDISFCAHCGTQPEQGKTTSSRICSQCGLGLVLRARGDTAPQSDEAFLVVDGALAVCAVSREAEVLLDTSEPHAIGTFLGQFFVPAAVTDRLTENFFALVRRAAHRSAPPRHSAVRRAGGDERYIARVGWCGKPSAALVVVTDSDF
jgi:hypothetical protein